MFDTSKKLLFSLLTLTILIFISSCSLAITNKEYPDVDIAYAPAVPSNLELDVDYVNKSLTLKWDKSKGASIYHIYYATIADYAENRFKQVNNYTESKSFSFAENGVLNQDDIYVFYVTASSSNSNAQSSDKSAYVTASTLSTFEPSITVSADFKPTITLSYSALNSSLDSTFVPNPYFVIKIYDNAALETPVHVIEKEEGTSCSPNFQLNNNTTYYFKIELKVEGSDGVVAEKTVEITTDKSYQPESVIKDSIVLSKNQKSSISVDFKVPEIPSYLKELNVEYRFRIMRISNGVVEVIHRETEAIEFVNEGGYYHFVDENLSPNTKYSYAFLSYYLFTEDGIYYVQRDTEEVISPESSYCLSAPRDVNATLTPTPAEQHTNYTLELNWFVDYEIPADAVFIISPNEVSDLEGSGIEPIEVPLTDESINFSASTEEEYHMVSYKKEQKPLTDEEAKKKHTYVYTVTMKSGDVTSQTVTSSASNTVDTVPSITEVVYISNFKADTRALGGRTSLSWDIANELPAELNKENIKLTIYRYINKDYSGERVVISDIPYTDESYEDINSSDNKIEDGTTYYYVAQAVYSDDGTDYNGTETLAYTEATTLGSVTGLTATNGTSLTESLLIWNAVSGAESYAVYYREFENEEFKLATNSEGYFDDTDNTMYHFTKDANTVEAGTIYEFKVIALDSEGNGCSGGESAKGSILGPNNLQPKVTSGADRITFSWTPIEGPDRYQLFIYDSIDATEAKISKRIDVDTTEYVLKYDSEDLQGDIFAEYPLSRDFYFSIAPVTDSVIGMETVRIQGSWIQPPKGITATKGDYRDMVKISWQPVAGASGYNVYRRLAGSSDVWKYVETTNVCELDIIVDSDEVIYAYEYTVSTNSLKKEGPLQNYFEDSDYAEYKANYGVALAYPKNVLHSQIQQKSGDLMQISFDENPFATGYQISVNGYDDKYIINASSLSTTIPEGTDGYFEEKDGTITIYVKRPKITRSPELIVDVQCRNEEAPLATNRVSFPHTIEAKPDYLTGVDVVNLMNDILYDIIVESNAAFGGDWWVPGGAPKYYNGEWFTASSLYGVGLGFKHDGLIEVDKDVLFDNGISVLAGSSFGVGTDGVSEVALNPIHYLSVGGQNSFSINLPLDLGSATVKIKSDANKGRIVFSDKSGTFEVTINETDKFDVNYSDCDVLIYR